MGRRARATHACMTDVRRGSKRSVTWPAFNIVYLMLIAQSFALKSHRQTAHLGLKVHSCQLEGCDKSFAHKSNLDRHVITHSQPSSPKEPDMSKQVTGEAAVERRYGCPEEGCEGTFWRVYDVRRHLKTEHELDLGDGEVRRWLARVRDEGKEAV